MTAETDTDTAERVDLAVSLALAGTAAEWPLVALTLAQEVQRQRTAMEQAQAAAEGERRDLRAVLRETRRARDHEAAERAQLAVAVDALRSKLHEQARLHEVDRLREQRAEDVMADRTPFHTVLHKVAVRWVMRGGEAR